MPEATLRPRYKFTCWEEAVEVRAKFLAALKDPSLNKASLMQHSVANHLIITLPRKERHFWSPTLDINLESEGSTQTTVRILIGPEPAIWTMFMFGYTVATLLFISGLILGYSQFILSQNSWTFIFTPIGIGLALLIYLSGLAGKYKAQEEMQLLKTFVELALGRELFPQERGKPEPLGNPG